MQRTLSAMLVALGLVAVSTAYAQQVEAPPKEIKKPDVVFVPTPQDVVEKMLDMVKVKKDDVLYDLGCGDGRIPVTAAKKYGCKAMGFDVDPQRIKESKENVEKNKVGKLVKIEQKDIFTLDLTPASVITLYLLPSLNVKLIPQLEKLKPGTRIVSHDFNMAGVKPEQVVKYSSDNDNWGHEIYFWTTPFTRGGRLHLVLRESAQDRGKEVFEAGIDIRSRRGDLAWDAYQRFDGIYVTEATQRQQGQTLKRQLVPWSDLSRIEWLEEKSNYVKCKVRYRVGGVETERELLVWAPASDSDFAPLTRSSMRIAGKAKVGASDEEIEALPSTFRIMEFEP